MVVWCTHNAPRWQQLDCTERCLDRAVSCLNRAIMYLDRSVMCLELAVICLDHSVMRLCSTLHNDVFSRSHCNEFRSLCNVFGLHMVL